MSVHSSVGGWFGESDDRFYIDGEEIPRMVGTGFEDYFTDAWNLRLFSNLFAGVTIREQHAEDARHTCYRWHIADPITFKKSLKVEIERRSFVDIKNDQTGEIRRGDFKYRADFCSSVAFWYQRTVATPRSPFPPLKERLLPEVWVVPRDMVEPTIPAGKSPLRVSEGLQPRRLINKMGWVNFKREIFYLANDKIGSWLEIPFKLDQKGRYSISVFQILFKEYGIWKLTLIGPGFEKVLDPWMDFWNPYIFSKEHSPESWIYGTNNEKKIGVYDLEPGEYVFRFECVGSNPLSRDEKTGKSGYGLGLDGISLRKLPWGDMNAWYDKYIKEEKRLQEQKLVQVRRDIAELAAAVEAYKRDHGKYPQSLFSLVERPADMNRQRGSWPYYKGTRVPLDPWGQHYFYLMPGIRNPQSFDLWSVCGDSRNESIWVGNWDQTRK